MRMPGEGPTLPQEARDGAEGTRTPQERENAIQRPCDHWDDEFKLWLCGCGDGMDDETHATQGMCDTCVMFDAPEPCDGLSPTPNPQEDAD